MPTPGDSGAEEPAKSYAFYDMLPKFEVVVPEKDKDVRPDIKSVPETRRGTYVLQAGSYKNFADADRVRAKLALQGVESKVQKVSVDTIPGTGSASGRSPSWMNSIGCGRYCARPMWMCSLFALVIRSESDPRVPRVSTFRGRRTQTLAESVVGNRKPGNELDALVPKLPRNPHA
jgi:hypothetical protein